MWTKFDIKTKWNQMLRDGMKKIIIKKKKEFIPKQIGIKRITTKFNIKTK